MQSVIQIGQYLIAHWVEILGGITASLSGLYALFLVIPGEQPDKVIQSVLEFTQRWSRK